MGGVIFFLEGKFKISGQLQLYLKFCHVPEFCHKLFSDLSEKMTTVQNWLALLPDDVMIKINRHRMDDVIHHMNQYKSYVAFCGKIIPLGEHFLMAWDNEILDSRKLKYQWGEFGYGSAYAPRMGCGCTCGNQGIINFICGCGYTEVGGSFAGYCYSCHSVLVTTTLNRANHHILYIASFE